MLAKLGSANSFVVTMYPPRLLEEEQLVPFESSQLGGADGLVPPLGFVE